MELRHYQYKADWLSMEQIGNLTLPLRDIQSRGVKKMALSVRAPALDYHNGMIAEKWSAEWNVIDTSTEDAIVEQGS